jgi:hypothetical protein
MTYALKPLLPRWYPNKRQHGDFVSMTLAFNILQCNLSPNAISNGGDPNRRPKPPDGSPSPQVYLDAKTLSPTANAKQSSRQPPDPRPASTSAPPLRADLLLVILVEVGREL